MAILLTFFCFIFATQVNAAKEKSDIQHRRNIKTNIGNSEIFSKKDLQSCVRVINRKFHEWDCKIENVRYAGDEFNSAENIKYLNDLAEGNGFKKEFSACMVFYSDFISPSAENNKTTFESDKEYKDWQWWFGLYSDGSWKPLTWGY